MDKRIDGASVDMSDNAELIRSLNRQAKALAVRSAIMDLIADPEMGFLWTMAVPGGTITANSTPPPERPDDGWDPNAPLSATNHPSCEACDQGITGAPCTCGDWEPLSTEE